MSDRAGTERESELKIMTAWRYQTRYDSLNLWQKLLFWLSYPEMAKHWYVEDLEEENAKLKSEIPQ